MGRVTRPVIPDIALQEILPVIPLVIGDITCPVILRITPGVFTLIVFLVPRSSLRCQFGSVLGESGPDRELPHHVVRMVALFRLSQAFNSKVLFPIDVGVLRQLVAGEPVIDELIHSTELWIGFLEVDHGRGRVQPLTDGKGLNLPINHDRPAGQ